MVGFIFLIKSVFKQLHYLYYLIIVFCKERN